MTLLHWPAQASWRAGAKRKKGHFSTRFGCQEGTLAHVFATQEGSLSCFNLPRGQLSVFSLPRGHLSMHFSARFSSEEGSLSYFNQPRGQLSVFWPPRGHLACIWAPKRPHLHTFWLLRGHFSTRFGSKEGTLAHVLAPKKAHQCTQGNHTLCPLPHLHTTARLPVIMISLNVPKKTGGFKNFRGTNPHVVILH